jgi:outer membrane protein OmpA-like peptidoglycan-associated protein
MRATSVIALLTAVWAVPAAAGRRPAASASAPAGGLVRIDGDRIRLARPIYFRVGTPSILPLSHDLLHGLARLLKSNPGLTRVRIEGHTDALGSSAYNKQMSQQRAEAVRDFLVTAGVAASRLDAVGFGKDQPIDSNLTEAGRARNRRIDFVVVERGNAGGSAGASARAHFARGARAFQAGKYAEAIAEFERAVAIEPRAAIHHNIGVANERLGRRAAAIAAFRRYLSLAPSGAMASAVRERISRLARGPK